MTTNDLFGTLYLASNLLRNPFNLTRPTCAVGIVQTASNTFPRREACFFGSCEATFPQKESDGECYAANPFERDPQILGQIFSFALSSSTAQLEILE